MRYILIPNYELNIINWIRAVDYLLKQLDNPTLNDLPNFSDAVKGKMRELLKNMQSDYQILEQFGNNLYWPLKDFSESNNSANFFLNEDTFLSLIATVLEKSKPPSAELTLEQIARLITDASPWKDEIQQLYITQLIKAIDQNYKSNYQSFSADFFKDLIDHICKSHLSKEDRSRLIFNLMQSLLSYFNSTSKNFLKANRKTLLEIITQKKKELSDTDNDENSNFPSYWCSFQSESSSYYQQTCNLLTPKPATSLCLIS